MITVTLLLLAGMAAVSLPREGSRCEFEEVRERNAPASEVLRVESGAGAVKIVGEPGLGEIRVTATLCASDRERFDALDVTLENGELRTRYPAPDRSWGRNRYARIAVDVRVPEGTGIDLDDSSGSTVIEGVGAVVVEDGSGSLRIRNAAGGVTVEDGSGGLRIDGVEGDVLVDDGSGSLSIRNVTGSVEVEDGSGSVTVRDVGGDVAVGDEGSGSIEIVAVGGDVRIGDPGSGGVEVRDVEGNFTVERGRRRRISWSDVRGKVEVPERR